MSVKQVVEAVLLCVAVASALVSVVGVARMRDVHDRVHYLGPVSAVGGAAVAAAVVVNQGVDTRGIKALIVLGILAGLNPLLVHATVRADQVRSSATRRRADESPGNGQA
jgi:multisubunit Na+/H+ antiporter MnhG subunit